MKNISFESINSYQHWLFLKVIMICLLVCYNVDKSSAQTLSWDYFVESLYADQELDQELIQAQVEELYDLHEHPFNINTATREQLKQLIFLTDQQIEDILYYLYRYGAMQTLGELKLIESLDFESRQFLQLFVYAVDKPVENRKVSFKELFKEGKNLLKVTFLNFNSLIKNRSRAETMVKAQLTKYQMCIGCSACASICRHSAIKVENLEVGNVSRDTIKYSIDLEKCVGCLECILHFDSGCYMKKVLRVKKDSGEIQ